MVPSVFSGDSVDPVISVVHVALLRSRNEKVDSAASWYLSVAGSSGDTFDVISPTLPVK